MRHTLRLPAADAWRGASPDFLLALLVAAVVIAAIIPPFQSPDETDHIKRAYLLGKGVILLDKFADKGSGGLIDSGLLTYMSTYEVLRGRADQKMTADQEYSV